MSQVTCKVVQDYVITPLKLGEGCFGTVYRGYVRGNKNEVLAVKAIPLKSIKNEEAIRREIEILLKLRSPHIVHFYHPVKTANHLYFFLEYCEQDLKQYFRQKAERLSEAQVQSFLVQICRGFEVVHRNNVIHRDIKPANFLIHQGTVKISDFGFARVVENVDEPVLRTFLGSPLYMAPQILAKTKFSSKCDVWSLGVTLFQLLYARTPYTAKTPVELEHRIRSQPLMFPQYPRRSEAVKQLLREMLQIEEENRLSFPQLFNHSYVMPSVPLVPQSDDTLYRSFAKNEIHISRNKVATHLTIEDPSSEEDKGRKEETKQIKNERKEKEQKKSEHYIQNERKEERQRINERQRKEEIQKIEEGKEPMSPTFPTPLREEQTQDFTRITSEQTEQIQNYFRVEQVDEFYRYRRNVSVFLNVQCNSFFMAGKKVLPQADFHKGLFILLQKQMGIHRETLKELDSKKPNAAHVSVELWQTYKVSPAFARLLRLLQHDLRHLEDYFQQVSKRMAPQQLEECAKLEAGTYCKVLTELLNQLPPNPDLRTKLLISTDPFKFLVPQLNFGLLYENETEQLEKIRKTFPNLN